jgi:energy-coupling factor transport system ATP-binding protein
VSGGLELAGVGIRYPGRREPALADIDVAAGPGEIVAIAGRTGAGKSTLALVAAGFIPRVVRAAVTGEARVGGSATTALTPAELVGRVGIVFSTPANQLSASKLTVREELAFGLENLGVPREEMDARIDAVLERLAIAHLADRDPFALSGGEQQRVAVASIVAMGTAALVLDEPTAQLDPAGKRSVAELLGAEAGAGRAVLVAEHDPTVLGRADRCLVLEGGRAVTTDLPGRALGSAVLAPLGLAGPTIVRLAEVGGVDPRHAFDPATVAEALGRLLGATSGAPLAGGKSAGRPRLDWAPRRPRDGARLAVEGLVHRYPGGVEALRGIDLAIAPGETVAIVGQNGSGKTTLIKHLDGLLRPGVGRVLVDGVDIADRAVSETARTVGLVFQDPDDQLFERSVAREVSFGPRNLGIADRAEVAALVEAALRLVGLEGVADANPYDLDRSTRKLVALASVLAMEPAALVLDEPTSGQDGPGVARVGAIVDAYADAGRTVVAITHDMEFAARHFRRVVVLRQGELVADGDPASVLGADRADLLASTGLEPPVAAVVGGRLGLGGVPTPEALLAAQRG